MIAARKAAGVACAAALLAVSFAVARANAAEVDGAVARPFELALERIAADNPASPGVILAVSSPTLRIEWQGARGVVERGKPAALRPTDAFRVASVTKVYTAATVLRLVEDGKFGLYDTIEGLLSERTARELKRGGYDPAAITVQQLLCHTAGIFDYAMSEQYLAELFRDPQRVWTRDEQISFAVDHGRKLSVPGAEYHYSDTGYVILGEIVERATGTSLPEAAARLIDYRRFGIAHTYFEKLQATPKGERRGHHYYGERDLTSADPSVDLYGGGGIVSTAPDLIRFVRPLIQGRVFKKDTTLGAALLIPPVQATSEPPHAPLLTFGRIGKRQCWGHSGFWGVILAYCPDIDLAIAVSWGQVTSEPYKPGSAAGFQGVRDWLGRAVDSAEKIRRSAAK